jgi:hypothetical protein
LRRRPKLAERPRGCVPAIYPRAWATGELNTAIVTDVVIPTAAI